MEDDEGRGIPAGSSTTKDRTPRFGSYIGLFYVAAIVGVLSFAVLRDSGTGHAFDRLQTGMTPTEVAALLGTPQAATAEGPRTIQTWRIPDGQTFVVEFIDGKLVQKRRDAR
ncbi:MAG: hypothetical protein U0790_08210 [Isosphaeraceae bacterium]